MDMGKFTSGQFFKAAELAGSAPLALTINDVALTDSNGMDAQKPVLAFDETEQRLVLNKTNLGVLIDAWGDESDDWLGRKIQLTTAEVMYQGKLVDGLRVKVSKAKAKAKAKVADDETDDIPF